mgnify:CR=1 FL=1
MSNLFAAAVVLLVSYFLGCINGSVMTSHFVIHDDVRQHGSGNAGLTNFYRTYGAKYALMVIAFDMGKTVVACLIGFGFCWEPSSFTCPWRSAGRQKAQPFPLSCMTTMKTGLSCSTPAVTTPPITARKPDSRCCSMNRIWRTGCPTAGAGDKHPLYG